NHAAIKSTPDDHFTASPYCRVNGSGSGWVGRAGGRPTIRAGIVPPAAVEIRAAIPATPDDHFTPSPHCRVSAACNRRVGVAGSYPAIGAGIVSPAGLQRVN